MIDSAQTTGGKATRARYLVLLWLCLAAVIAYVHRGCLSVPAQQIQKDLGLTDIQMGGVMSAFFWSYALFQVPAGWLAGRWGSRLALSVFSTTWSAATGFMGLASGSLGLAGSNAVNGFGQAGLFPASVNTISKWFPVSQRAFPSGGLGGSMQVGAALGSLLVGFLLKYWNWPTIFIVLSLAGFVWSAGFYWWFRNLPGEHPRVNVAECEWIRAGSFDAQPPPAATAVPPAVWAVLLTSPQMLCICGQQFFRAAGNVFYMTWFPTYLQKTHDVSVAMSGYLTMLPLLGVAIGALLGGAISDWILTRTNSRRLARKGVAVAGLVGCALLIFAAYFVADPTQAVLIIMLGSFCAGIASPAGYTITMDLSGDHILPVFSTMNMVGNFGAAFCPLLVAWLVTPSVSSGRVATGQNWELVLLLFVAIYLAAAGCWIIMNTDRGIFPADNAPT